MVNRPTFRSYAIYCTILVFITASPADADVFSAILIRQTAAVGQLQDLKKRHTADALLKKAREALRDNNLQLAEFYVEGAERLDIEYESLFAKFNDTPAKVRVAMEQKRGELRLSGAQVSRPTGNLPSDRFAAKAAYEQPIENNAPPADVPTTLAGLDRNDASITGPLGKSDAIGYLKRGQKALASGNLVAAVGWYKSAAALEVDFGPDEYSPGTLHAELVQAGVAPDQLLLSAPTTADRSPPPGYTSARAEPVNLAASSVQPPSSLVDPQSVALQAKDAVTSSSLLARAAKIHSNMPGSDSKQESASQRVRQLLAQADAALNRGELEVAEEFVLRAQEIQLPESAYEKGDRRPWMVLMEINRAHKRKYSVPSQVAAGDVFGPPPAQPTYGPAAPHARPNQLSPAQVAAAKVTVTGTGQQPQVAYGNYQPHLDNSYNMPAAGNTNAPAAQFAPANQEFSPPSTAGPQGSGPQGPSPVMAAQADAGQGPQFPAYDLTTPGPFANAPIAPNQQLLAPSQAMATPPQTLTAHGPTAPPVNQNPTPRFSSPPPAQIQLPATDPTKQAPSTTVAQPFVAAPLLRTSPPAPRAVDTSSPPAAVPGQVQGLTPDRENTPLQTVVNPFKSQPSKAPAANNSKATPGNTVVDAGKNPPPELQLAERPKTSKVPTRITEGDLDEPTPSIGDFGKPKALVNDNQAKRSQGVPADPQRAVPSSPGDQLFAEGVRSLETGQTEEALALFREAWAFESELDPDTRQKLQDYLQHLRRQVAAGSSVAAEPDTLSLDAESSAESQVAGEASGTEKARIIALEHLLRDLAAKRISVQAIRQSNPKKAWDELNQARDLVVSAKIDEKARGQLLQRTDQEIAELEDYINQNRARIENDERNRQVLAEIDRRREQQVQNQQKLAELVEEFNQLMEQQRYAEAVVTAKTAREIDPQNPVVQNMIFTSQTARQVANKIMRDENFQQASLEAFSSVDEAAVGPQGETGLQFPKSWDELTKRRKNLLARQQRRYSESELEIQRSLTKPVEVHYSNTPLSSVVDQLAKMAGINVYLDPEGLAAEGVTSDTLVSIDLRKSVSLKSALNLILAPLHLSYVIQDEVLRITSEQVRDGDVYAETYNVADLVLPIPNFVPSHNIGLPGAIREAHSIIGQGGQFANSMNNVPLTVAADNPGMGPASTSASVLAQIGSMGMLGSGYTDGAGNQASGGGSLADFDTLIELITSTIEPDTWEEVGGPGSIQGFAGTLSLVVSQTQDVHERIVDLLEQLRRLQDLQVTIEVRFIILNDDFFERIGIDFDFNLQNDSGVTRSQVQQQPYQGPNVVVGLDPLGTPTVGLEIPWQNRSFTGTRPTFGGFTPDSATTVGFAILSDIEAFFLIEASQGDTRSNVLQAPKVTLFNGQQAFVSDTSQRPFVTSVIPVVGDFAAAHQPVITVLSEGTSLSVQAVVSQDRRFIRLTLVPFFSQIGDVDTFTFTGTTTSDSGTTAVDPADSTSKVKNNERTATAGTTVQLPTFSFTTVNTTVSVPDGGTILLGGIKRLSEGRNELGVPMLSKLPYVNRLFTNVGIGRETTSLMMMVTPRIIIQEEEEEKLLGTTSGS